LEPQGQQPQIRRPQELGASYSRFCTDISNNYPFPDFNVNHQFRDFDALVDWAVESTVDQTLWKKQDRPKGVKEVPAPMELLDWIAKGGRMQIRKRLV
jgi:hypothetical protein